MHTNQAQGNSLRSLRGRVVALLVGVAVVGPVAAVPTAVAEQAPRAVAAHSCSTGYTHAVLSWGHKCLRAGQYCKKGKNREYHRYGYHCKRNGRLKRY
jgi:hypothetical protein